MEYDLVDSMADYSDILTDKKVLKTVVQLVDKRDIWKDKLRVSMMVDLTEMKALMTVVLKD